jgi:hypothetical protein
MIGKVVFQYMKDIMSMSSVIARCVDSKLVIKPFLKVNRLLKSQFKPSFVPGLKVQSLDIKMVFSSITRYFMTADR